eukprot:TRINITY_DN2635_c0_g1_i1.p1 TRINITY_DN2635_c0_g1~~TRINITY_DN2635_c0_g1_i1.p1  ORF type:complete len:238 (+),score=27.94 TRINITY_DN2635_c0_g1_i1:335-1048(+)
MKKTQLIFLLFLLSAIVAYSQSVIKNPRIGLSLNNNSTITKVELTDTATVLSICTKYTPGWWISIPKETYIQPVGGEKLFIKYSVGIPLNDRYTMPVSGDVSYKLIFPAIAKTTSYIDYGEANEGGSWFIYDIEIKPAMIKSGLPKGLSGNWFDKSTGNWEFGFYDKYIVYKNKLWSFNYPKIKKAVKSLNLKSDGEYIELFYKITSPNNVLLGLSAQDLNEYSNNAAEAQKKKTGR